MYVKSILIAALCFCFSGVVGQDTVRTDSVPRIIIANPGEFGETAESATFSHYDVGNKMIADNAKGVPLLYTLYGQVPNLSLSFENMFSSYEGFRHKGSPVAAEDGIPVNYSFLPYSSATSFDYHNIQVIPDLNGSVMFGPTGSNGVLIAQSKNGRDDERGTIEVNSFTQKEKVDLRDGHLLTDQDFTVQSSALALQRDFGKIDARVSVNHSGLLAYDIGQPDADYKANRLTVNANTGYVNGKSELRAIMRTSHMKNVIGGQQQDVNLFHSQLKFKHDVADDLKVSSNVAFQKAAFDISAVNPFSGFNTDESRVVANTFVHHSAKLKEGQLYAFGGLQFEWFDYEKMYDAGYTAGGSFNVMSAMAEVQFHPEKALYFNAGFRLDAPRGDETAKVFSAGGGVLLHELLHMNTSRISFARFRMSYGFSDVVATNRYPQLYRDNFNYPYLGNEKKALETGFDINGNQEKWKLTVVYYNDKMLHPDARKPLTQRGIEMIARVSAIRSKASSWNNTLLLNYSNSGSPSFYGVTTDTTSGWTTRQRPDFGLSHLAEIRHGGLQFNVMLDWRSVRIANAYQFSSERNETLRIRFASLGYEFVFSDGVFKTVTASIVARNFMITDKPDPETIWSGVTRSVGLNLNFVF